MLRKFGKTHCLLMRASCFATFITPAEVTRNKHYDVISVEHIPRKTELVVSQKKIFVNGHNAAPHTITKNNQYRTHVLQDILTHLQNSLEV